MDVSRSDQDALNLSCIFRFLLVWVRVDNCIYCTSRNWWIISRLVFWFFAIIDKQIHKCSLQHRLVMKKYMYGAGMRMDSTS